MAKATHEPDPALPGNVPWRVAITGASGMIGGALIESLRRDGHTVERLVRSRPGAGSGGVYWDVEKGEIEGEKLEGIDALVHLAGENVFGIWTEAKKRRIRESRARGTRLVAETLAALERPPRVLVSASGIGYYGDSRGDEILDEGSTPGDDFLASVTRNWEAGTGPAAAAGIRVVNTRFGLVMSGRGGMLPVMLLPFRLGVGGKLGDGKQWMSWVALADVVGAIRFAFATESLSGPVNVTAPEPVTNAEFTRTLGRVLGRPTLLTVPRFAMRLAMGEMADNTALASQRAVPRKLLDAGYHFRYPALEGALHAALAER